MKHTELNVVTGAFGYTGKYITRQLLSVGKEVRSLTGHPNRNDPLWTQIDTAPFSFEDTPQLIKSLKGATTLYNTYWVRFPYGRVTFDVAVANTRKLIRAAQEAGVRRLVHFSVTNASEESRLPYFRGKGIVERAIMDSGLSYAIIRPTVVFGREDILINNIAWLLRKFPIFPVPGSGGYKLQPIFAGDLAEIAVNAGQLDASFIVDAAGPDIYTFNELIHLLAKTVRSRAKAVHTNPRLALFLSGMVGHLVGDVLLTEDEVRGLMANHLISSLPPTGRTRLTDWLVQQTDTIGVEYASELSRHFRGMAPNQGLLGDLPARRTREVPTSTTIAPKA